MSLGQQLLLSVPSWVLGLIVVSGAVIFSIAGLLIMRRFIPHHRLKLHNDVTGPIFGTLGTVYAVLLAFVVVIVWENFEKSRVNVEREANCLAALYQDSEAFSRGFKQEVRNLTGEYAQAVVNQEWKTIARGQASTEVEKILDKLWLLYSNYLPRTETEKAFFEESVHKLNELRELRATRIIDSKTGVHPLLWFVLIFGGLTAILFTFFFGVENLRAQLVMGVLLAVLISLILFTILSLDFPFSGAISVSPSAFRQVFMK